MKIVKLKGGLGNQMFQYAYAKLLQQKTGDEVYLDYSAFTDLKGDTVRVPRLDKFCLSIPKANKKQIDSVCLFKHRGNSQTTSYRIGIALESIFNKKYFREPDRAYIDPSSIIRHNYFDGYWQSWRYVDKVKEELVHDFKPNYSLSNSTTKMQNTMKSQNAVFVGVRRGDYNEEAAHYGSFSSKYYQNAMNFVAAKVKNPVFYVFSNDVPWCKENMDWGRFAVEYREPEQQTSDFEELMLMASCKHSIIINSSYHWWGATLISNTNKIVCCPEKWWFDDKPIDIIPKGWVSIKDEI